MEGACLREGVQQEDSLSPGGVDLVPLHGHRTGAAQAEAQDGGKGAVMPNVESVIDYIGAPQPVQVRGRPVDLWRNNPARTPSTCPCFAQ